MQEKGGCCWAGLNPLLLSLLLGLNQALYPAAETLEVKMGSQMTASMNSDVLLPCTFYQFATYELDIRKMGVTWTRKTFGMHEEQLLYEFFSGNHSPHRNGSRLNDSELRRGNASLFLPQIQTNEEGTYRCSVIVTPEKAEGTSSLEVVAQPVVTLSPKEIIEIEQDKEKTLTCAVNKFYPSLIVVRWQKDSKHTPDKGVSAEDICTGASVKNEDGTFNITSKLRLQPSSQDNGNIYSCIVEHKSFPKNLLPSVELLVTAPPQDLNWVAGMIAALVILVGAGTSVGIVYHRWFKKIPPKIKALSDEQEQIIKHLQGTDLRYLITGFRPKPLGIALFLVTDHHNEKQKIFSWNSEANDAEQGPETSPLCQQNNFKFDLNITKQKRGIFDVHFGIVITPDIQDLPDEFKLDLEVMHEAFDQVSYTETKSFKIRISPKLDEVQCSTDVPRPDEPLTLSCRIHSYFPKPIEVQWYKDDELLSGAPFGSIPIIGRDGLFFCNSSIKYLPRIADVGKKFSCKVSLQGTQQYKESVWKMKTLVCAPVISQIECEPSVPECGRAATLSCILKDFYPPECDISWIKGSDEFTHANITTEEPQLITTNLYCRKSQVSFTPNPEDHAVDITVEINHCRKIIRKTCLLMLKGFPKVANVLLEPRDAEYGKALSLTCKVKDFYPKDIHIQWLHGDNTVRNGIVTEGPLEYAKGCFKLSSKFQMKPTALDYGNSISFKVAHEKLAKPITKKAYLKLPAKRPVLSEIKIKQAQPSSGEDVFLEISISDFAPRDIRVVWYKEWKQLPDDCNRGNICIGENQLCFLTSKIQFKPNSTDFGKAFRCVVSHPASESSQEKSIVLKDKGLRNSMERILTSPVNKKLRSSNSSTTSKASMKIECVTIRPKAGEEVTFRCLVHGRKAEEAHVAWYKGLFPVDEEIANANCDDGSGFVSCVTIQTEGENTEYEIRCEVSMDAEHLEETYRLQLK